MTNWFQTDECYEFYKSLSFMEVFKFEIKRGGEIKGRIVGYIQKDGSKLKQFFSRRAIIHGGPYLADDITNEEIAELLHKCKTELHNKCIYIETRNYSNFSNRTRVFINEEFKYEPHLNFIVPTPDEQTCLQNLDKSRRKKINKAIREGVDIITNPSIEDVRSFYSILQNLYKEKVKTPLFPFEFFEKLYYRPFGKILIAKYQGIVIGGQVCICDKGNVVYEMFMAGKDQEYKQLSPSSIATYSGIQHAATNGFRLCDMMGAGKPNIKYGVRDFKASFGGELVEYGRFKCILNWPLYFIGVIGVKIMKTLK